ncbi:MAG: SRPBCC family protein [Rhodothermales bacterium]
MTFKKLHTRHWILLAVCLPTGAVIAVAGYLFSAPDTAEAEVVIDAPIEAVWAYVGESRNAHAWSVYFHHITPKRTSGSAPDGTPGALRICYRHADETGVQWDEVIVMAEQEDTVWTRRLRSFNLRGFSGVPGLLATRTAYNVEQRYVALGPRQTALRFRTRLEPGSNALLRLAFRPYRNEMERIFRLNLENIKAAVEAETHGVAYVRPHPYEPSHSTD